MAIATSGLILWYDGIDNAGQGMHNSSATTWTDLSGNGNHGTVYNSRWGENRLMFDGSKSWVNCGQRNPSNLTMEIFVEPCADNLDKGDIFNNMQSGGYGFSSKEFVANIDGSYQYVGNYGDLSGTRFHLAASYDGKIMKVYVNGSKIAEQEITGTIKSPSNSTVLSIGSNPSGTSMGINPYAGAVYSARLYSRALSEAEILANYEHDAPRFASAAGISADNLTLWYDGIDNTGTGIHDPNAAQWTDLSGNGNHGTVYNALWDDGQRLTFNGFDTWVDCGRHTPSHMTVEVLFDYTRIPNLSGSDMSVVISNMQSGGFGLVQQSGKCAVTINYSGTWTSLQGFPCETDKLMCVAFSYDGSRIKMYRNGNLIGSIEKSGSIKTPINSTVLMLGSNPNGSDAEMGFLYGHIYAVRLYQRALFPSEIKSHYEIEKDRFAVTPEQFCLIRKTTLAALAEQARRLSGSTNEMRPTGMVEALETVTK